MKQTIFTFLILLGCLSALLAQKDSARVSFLPLTDSIYYVQIDGVTYPNLETIILKKRTYDIDVWSPGREVVDTFLDVSKKNQLTFIVPFENTTTYNNYLLNRKKHRAKTFAKYALPVGAILGSAAYTYHSKLKGKRLQEEAERIRINYTLLENHIFSDLLYKDDISKLKGDYANKEEEVLIYEDRYKTGLVLTGISSAVSVYFLIRLKAHKKTKPIYQTEPNPFELNSIGFNYMDNTSTINLSFIF
jgi:hypothetical protein